MVFWFSLGVLALAFVFQLGEGFRVKDLGLKRVARFFLFGSVAVVGFYYVYLTYAQYVAWRGAGPPASYLLPPYRGVAYLFSYHFVRFTFYYLISLAAAGFFLWLCSYSNRKFGRRFFGDEEPYLGALAIFILGNPEWGYAWIYYVVALLVVYFLLHLLSLMRGRFASTRIPLYWLWLPVGILTIMIVNFVY